MGKEIYQELDSWIKHISTPTESLGNLSVCPYAKGADYTVEETDGSNINPPPWYFDLIIYILPDYYSFDDLQNLSIEYNRIYPELVFLPDHKNRDTFINGVKTNNGFYNLLLCQYRSELERARSKLKNTTYYSFWAEDYLKEILNT
jgi:hypothetical protein